MGVQAIIVGVLLTLAATYFCLILWRKVKSFSKSSNKCNKDCNCD